MSGMIAVYVPPRVGHVMNLVATAQPLLSLSATEMAEQIREGAATSLELVELHIARIKQVNPALNAMVVPLFSEARAAAEAADRELNSGQDLGPLHGVPVSIKEFFDVSGTLTTAGIESREHVPAVTDAPTVARLRRAGAILLGKTNVPQLGTAIETDNPVYGRTSNPWDIERSPGGSSGGESALIAAGGSPLGLASDGGGSIRIPAHFCGLCGLKPTTNRLTMQGHWQFPAFPHGWSQPGPLARTVTDLETALSVLVPREGEALDPAIAPGEIGPSAKKGVSNLRVGYFIDQFLPVAPAIRRACKESIEVLTNAGATLVDIEPPDALKAWEIELGLIYADGGKWMRSYLGTSRVDPRIKKALLISSLPTPVRRFAPILLDAMGEKTLASVVRQTRHHHLSAFGFQKVLIEQDAFRLSFLRKLNERQIDALICPPFPSPAMNHSSPDIVLAHVYTFMFNLLGMPAGVVPVTTVQHDEESDRAITKDSVLRDLHRAEQGSRGLPVGVQVVAKHWREDVALSVMHCLFDAFSEREFFPSTPVPT